MDFSFVSSAQPLQRKPPSQSSQPQPSSASAQQCIPQTRTIVQAETAQVAASARPFQHPPPNPPVASPMQHQSAQQQQQHGAGSRVRPTEQVVFNPNAIIVSRRQQGNPLLSHIRNVRWQYGDIVPDYQMGTSTCALFLSLRFHLLKPEYVHHRIKQLQRAFRLRLVLVLVDIEDVVDALNQVTRAALLNECTLICCFSPQECARYLETFKSFETKNADSLQGRTEEDYLSRLNAAMTAVRGVNKTNVLTLGRAFGTAAGIMQASMEELSACPGIGPTKVRRLHDTFHEPFRRTLQAPAEGNAQPSAAGTTSKGNLVEGSSDKGDPAKRQSFPMNDDALLFD